MTASWALQKAIHAALVGDATLMALVTGVHDHVPEDAQFPYVAIGEDDVDAFDGKTFRGAEHAMSLHVWSRARGRREAKEILDRLGALLDQAALAVAGHTLIDLRFVAEETALERDGLTYHGRARLRAVTQEAS